MSNLADKRNRFELLMQQAEIPGDMVRTYFMDGYIDQVEISRKNRDWTFYLVKEELVPQPIYRSFCKMIQEK
ncbi:PolC-type DNA polymerase III N-terminal domain-containing protein, partial [Paenibacillus whitsoniae]